jgi:hypothetical protein
LSASAIYLRVVAPALCPSRMIGTTLAASLRAFVDLAQEIVFRNRAKAS